MLVKSVEKKEDNSVVFQVESDAAEFEAAVASAYKKNKSKIYIPGFRKGKAPRTIVEGMYGADVFYQDALDEIAPEAFDFAVKGEGLKLVGSPAIVDFKVTDERTASFTFKADMYPVPVLGEYKGLKAEKDVVSVSEEELENELKSVQRRNSRQISVERAAQLGDKANIDFDGYLDGERFDGGKAEGYFLELGSNSFVPGFEDQIVGMSIGEEKEINITFPEDYVENLAGKAVIFKVKLNGLTYEELPELDDEFAKDVSEYDTLDEYKASLLKELEERHEKQNESAVRAELTQLAIDNMQVTIPESMIRAKEEDIVRNYAANYGMDDGRTPFDQLCRMMGLDEEGMNNAIRPTAEFQVKNDLLLDAIAEAEQFEISDEDKEKYIADTAEKMGATAEQFKSYFGEEFILDQLKKERASNLIFDSAVITEKKPAKKARKSTKKAEAAEASEAAEAVAEEKPAKKTRKSSKKEEVAE